MESAVNFKGQVTIPSAVREHLGLKPGDRVKFFLHPQGGVVLLPVLPVTFAGHPQVSPGTASDNRGDGRSGRCRGCRTGCFEPQTAMNALEPNVLVILEACEVCNPLIKGGERDA